LARKLHRHGARPGILGVMRTASLFALLAAVVAISIVGYVFFNNESAPEAAIVPTRTISIEGKSLRVAVADTDALRAQGLSGSDPLAENEGMLFVFAEDGTYSFWMKDMRYAIDILWLDAEGRVVHIEKGIAPETYPTSFTSHSPSRYVLEVRAGYADQHDIQIGSRATLEE
jgi:uncharacterized membrane protein (UPF0127 family)